MECTLRNKAREGNFFCPECKSDGNIRLLWRSPGHIFKVNGGTERIGEGGVRENFLTMYQHWFVLNQIPWKKKYEHHLICNSCKTMITKNQWTLEQVILEGNTFWRPQKRNELKIIKTLIDGDVIIDIQYKIYYSKPLHSFKIVKASIQPITKAQIFDVKWGHHFPPLSKYRNGYEKTFFHTEGIAFRVDGIEGDLDHIIRLLDEKPLYRTTLQAIIISRYRMLARDKKAYIIDIRYFKAKSINKRYGCKFNTKEKYNVWSETSLLKLDNIIIPLDARTPWAREIRGHYYLAIVDVKQRHVRVIDSVYDGFLSKSFRKEHVKFCVDKLFPSIKKDAWTICQKKTKCHIEQPTNYECGYVVLYQIENFLQPMEYCLVNESFQQATARRADSFAIDLLSTTEFGLKFLRYILAEDAIDVQYTENHASNKRCRKRGAENPDNPFLPRHTRSGIYVPSPNK